MSKEPKKDIDENGRSILKYDSGLIRDVATGHIIHPPESAIIRTSERGAELGHIRHEKVKEKVRGEILKVSNESRPPSEPEFPDADSAYAFGVGQTWNDSVLNPDSYPRDKIDALEVIGKLADLIPNNKQPVAEIAPSPTGLNLFGNMSIESLVELAEALQKSRQEEEIQNDE